VLRANGLQVESIDVDGDGIRVGDFVREPRLIVITPSHQFPMGVIDHFMSPGGGR
jgi:GntR family transcriptional regulator / MocR family aminotransferase